jgi:hypothetical protein
MRIGPALSCEELFEEKVEAGSDDAILRRALARAEAALRAKL